MKKKLLTLAATLAMVLAAASPAVAQEGAAEDQYGGVETGSISGVVTEAGGGSVTVEGASSADACGAAILALGEGTEILIQQDGQTAPATAEDLTAGQTVEASYVAPEGPTTQECPQTYDAQRIVILDGPGTPPGDQYDPPSGGGNGSGNGSGSGGSSSGSGSGSGGSAAAASGGILPDTGGVSLIALGAAALLLGGGLVARRIVR